MFLRVMKKINGVKEEKIMQTFKIPVSTFCASESRYLPIHFSKKLINGLSWIWMHRRLNSLPTNRVQLINKYNTWCICFCFPWQKKNSWKTLQPHKVGESVWCNLGFLFRFLFVYYSCIMKCYSTTRTIPILAFQNEIYFWNEAVQSTEFFLSVSACIF